MGTGWIALGALACALAVVGGAFGAHGLESRLDARALAQWETAARYLMYAGLSLLFVGLAAHRWPRPGLAWAAWCLALGGAVFSGTVAALALGGPRWLGAVTPIGGTLLIAGYLVLGWVALRV